MMSFKFKHGDKVVITISGEQGEVKGRADYDNSCNSYWVRYKAADGQATSRWWDEDALELTSEIRK